MTRRRARLLVSASLALLSLIAGCKAARQVIRATTDVARQEGIVTDAQKQSIDRTGDALVRSAEPIESEQEYYIGRSVAATLLGRYGTDDSAEANRYLNLLGQAMALSSDRPEIFGGYSFQVMDSDEINAFASPGGHILISRGLIRCCKTEDQLAAVLAHEVAHVQNRDGAGAIKKDRLTSALKLLAVEGTGQFTGRDMQKLTAALKGSVGDVCSTLVQSGYSRSQEAAADEQAVKILRRAGYDPRALIEMLNEMSLRLKSGGTDFAATHPSPADRIAKATPLIGPSEAATAPNTERQRRFERALSGI